LIYNQIEIFNNLQFEVILLFVFLQTSKTSNLTLKCFIFAAVGFMVVHGAWKLLGWRLNSNKALSYQNILSHPAALIMWIPLIYLLVI